MKHGAVQNENDPPVSYPARPPGSLPSFSQIRKLPEEERHAPLEAWVVWMNTNRGRMNPELESQLDEVLAELEAIDVTSSDFDRVGRRFDDWLDGLGEAPNT